MDMDHPRTRGVYSPNCGSWGRPCGSSPHTRGLLEKEKQHYLNVRIIPAHAGFTASPRSPSGRRADHPRTRGVYPSSARALQRERGSSPHTRGLHPLPAHRRPAAGIIPAHAGFTWRGTRRPRPRRDHPRTRGVYAACRSFGCSWWGSSPHTRGLRQRAQGPERHGGIIPAHAGFTATRPRRAGVRPDHPRTRGVYDGSGVEAEVGHGSSPHTRGLRVTPRCWGVM